MGGCNFWCSAQWWAITSAAGLVWNYLMSGATNAVYFVSASNLQQ